MFKRLAVLLLLVLFCNTKAYALSAKSSILIDAHTGRVLMSQNSLQRLGMASTTKIMTALVAIETGRLDDIVAVSPKAAGMEGSSMYLKSGEKIRLHDLIYGLMLNSGNDAGAAIAEFIGGDVKGFADIMNQKAKNLGLKDTSFSNPHGLDDENHYTTAYDLAQITRHALEISAFAEIVSTKVKTIYTETDEGSYTRTLVNHNKMLSLYKGADGVKTGFTKKCGRCLVSSATKDGLKLIAVTLNAPDDWNDHSKMLDFGFSNYKWRCPVKTDDYMRTVPLIGAESDKVTLYAQSDVQLAMRSNDIVRIVYDVPNFLEAPIYEGQCLGRADVYLGSEKIKTIELIAKEDIMPTNKNKIKSSCLYLFKELYSLFGG